MPSAGGRFCSQASHRARQRGGVPAGGFRADAAGRSGAVRIVGGCLHRNGHRRGDRSGSTSLAHEGGRGRHHRQCRRPRGRTRAGRPPRAVRAVAAASELRRAHRAGAAGRCRGARRPRDLTAHRQNRRAAAVHARRGALGVRHRGSRRLRGLRGHRHVHGRRAVVRRRGRRHRQPRRGWNRRRFDLRGVGGGAGRRQRRRTAARGGDRLRRARRGDGDSRCGAVFLVASRAGRAADSSQASAMASPSAAGWPRSSNAHRRSAAPR